MTPRAQLWLAAGGAALVAGAWLWRHMGLGYSDGTYTGLVWLVDVDGVQVESAAGAAFVRMQAAAKGAGVKLQLNSGFRNMGEQKELYADLLEGRRTAAVAKPGYSNHQRGKPEKGRGPAVDVAVQNSTASAEYRWLATNAARFGFTNTGANFGEPWHWEYLG